MIAWEVDDKKYCQECYIAKAPLLTESHVVRQLTESDLNTEAADWKSDLIDQGASTGVIITILCAECGTTLYRY